MSLQRFAAVGLAARPGVASWEVSAGESCSTRPF
jgi:hypothetical protein